MQNSNEQEHPGRPTSRAENTVARSLRMILGHTATGDSLDESNDLRSVLSAMEYFIPEVLQIHREWNDESLDAVLPLVTRKTGEREFEVLGQCILISDQTIVPIHLHLQVHPSEDRVSWLECRLGEKGPHEWCVDRTGLPVRA